VAGVSRRGGMIKQELMVDRPQPGVAVLAKALDRHIGPAAGALMRTPFGLGDKEALRGLVLPVTLPRVRPDQRKWAEAGSHCPLTPEGPSRGISPPTPTRRAPPLPDRADHAAR
jgi:hypothetical protein